MYKRQVVAGAAGRLRVRRDDGHAVLHEIVPVLDACLLYTSDAADERSSVDLGGRRIIKKKNDRAIRYCL